MKQPKIGERIRKLAEEILRANPPGLNYTELCRKIQDRHADLNWNTIQTQTWEWLQECNDVEKPSRGHYRIVTHGADSDAGTPLANGDAKFQESDFYEPFANWLTTDVEDATKAIPLGGNKFGGKWGTPDVLGKRISKPGDIVKQPTEIVSAEIKTNPNELITAFGQAVAYCLFSHRSYLVIPKNAKEEEVSKLDSLCQTFGLGLVLFDTSNPKDPNFEIRTRPRRQEPDYFYMNENMKKIPELFA